MTNMVRLMSERYRQECMKTRVRELRMLIVKLANYIHRSDEKYKNSLLSEVFRSMPKKFKNLLNYTIE